ncbi:MAG: Hsp20/alpha crystallin family protein [Bacteroidaceae bacterium]|nr:Hsp20/alpha crystallin family protein [Bacteroidaceae bacterium]
MPMKHGGQHWIPSIFNDFFNNELLVRNSCTAPAINVFETEKEYKVEVAAAGMCKDDFKISIDSENDLTITMEKNCNCGCDSKEKGCSTDKGDGKSCGTEKGEEKEECKGRYIRREFSYSKFQQTLIMPENADTAKIEAKVKHGVLCIRIPKKMNAPQEKTARVIEIE